MATPLLWDLAGEVRDAINDATFSVPFVAYRDIKPSTDLEQLATLRATVVPMAMTRELMVRGHDRVGPTLNIGLQQVVAQGDDEAISNLISATEELSAWILGRVVAWGGNKLTCQTVEIIAIDHQEVHEQGVYCGLIAAVFVGSDRR